MPRVCFIIMPFSTTNSCSDSEWTNIYETFFKPAIEGAGLDYECRRSMASRGNIVGSILRDLKDSYIVLADLTDRNANVFYELGVRHTLKDRTILVAQDEQDIPFDLRAYAYHIYDWRTEEGKVAFQTRLKSLLSEVDSNPDRPDNPVSDFLGRTHEPTTNQPRTTVHPNEVAFSNSLVGPSSDGVDPISLAHSLSNQNAIRELNTISRLTRHELVRIFSAVLGDLNQRRVPNQVRPDEVLNMAREYIDTFASSLVSLNRFVLACVEEQWEPGLKFGLKISGTLISLSEQLHPGPSIKFSQGSPALLAFQLLLCCGSKALGDGFFDLLKLVINEPIEVEDSSNRFSNLPLTERRDLFFPDALLGNAYFGAQYLVELWDNAEWLRAFYPSKAQYHFEMAQFMMIVCLAVGLDESGHSLYPGYQLFPEAQRAMSALVSRLVSSPEYLFGISGAIGVTPEQFYTVWTERVRVLNETSLGQANLRTAHHVRFPVQLRP